jgi:hypothetical protein
MQLIVARQNVTIFGLLVKPKCFTHKKALLMAEALKRHIGRMKVGTTNACTLRQRVHRRNPFTLVNIQRRFGGGSMKNVKSGIGFIFLVGVCLTFLWAEYNLAMRFPIMFSVASISGLLALLGALLRAPDGYEDENGFHIPTRREQAPTASHLA